MTLLVAVPNLSEGRDRAKLERLEAAVAPARVLDVHADPDHNRAVFTWQRPARRRDALRAQVCRGRGLLREELRQEGRPDHVRLHADGRPRGHLHPDGRDRSKVVVRVCGERPSGRLRMAAEHRRPTRRRRVGPILAQTSCGALATACRCPALLPRRYQHGVDASKRAAVSAHSIGCLARLLNLGGVARTTLVLTARPGKPMSPAVERSVIRTVAGRLP